MNNIQIEQLDNKLKELGKFVTNHKEESYKEVEIINWISDCVNLFYEIGVDSVIIRNFLDHFRFNAKKVELKNMFGGKDIETINTIGPFEEEIIGSATHSKTGKYVLAGSFYYAKVAFSLAKNTLRNKTAEKYIVPFWLVDLTKEEENIRHLASSCELIENKYENKDADGLIVESITLLDSILNLDLDLKMKDGIGGKLSSLIDDKAKLQNFGVSKDLVIGLNCGRILRNVKVIHKDAPIKYEIPFLIATSFAYLVLFFFECAILNGNIIKLRLPTLNAK